MTQPTTTTTQNGPAPATPQPAAMVRAPAQSIEPQNFRDLEALATRAAGSNFYGAKTPEQALMLMMTGRDLGLSYTQALRMFHVIEGKPTLSADGMVGVCLQHRDVCEYFRVEADEKKAIAVTRRVGDVERSYTFTIEDAGRAGLMGKPNWKNHPRRMLSARAKAFLARDVYPELLAGLYDPDEMDERRGAATRPADVVAVVIQDHDPAARARFAEAMKQAKDARALKAVGASVAAAAKHGVLNEADCEALAASYQTRSDELKVKREERTPAPPQVAPKSEPAVESGEPQ